MCKNKNIKSLRARSMKHKYTHAERGDSKFYISLAFRALHYYISIRLFRAFVWNVRNDLHKNFTTTRSLSPERRRKKAPGTWVARSASRDDSALRDRKWPTRLPCSACVSIGWCTPPEGSHDRLRSNAACREICLDRVQFFPSTVNIRVKDVVHSDVTL